ncbi:hypothetical protein BLOT_004269 [Blomia tropicalis]|nr:hypothetical protein BLOT_004269 [Blomia tropicalis]
MNTNKLCELTSVSANDIPVDCDSETSIYTISNSYNEKNIKDDIETVQLKIYTKHTNLDTLPLTFFERIHLARIHYFTIINCVRLFFVVFCFVWFVFSSTKILKDYSAFDTDVFVEYQNPDRTHPPAVTICTHCLLCSLSNETIENTSALDILEHDAISHQLTFGPNVVIDCSFYSSTIEFEVTKFDCQDMMKVTIQEGHKCFTFFSDIYGELTKAIQKNSNLIMRFDQFPQIIFDISGNFLFDPFPELHWHKTHSTFNDMSKVSKMEPGLFLTIHDPSALPDMFNMYFHQLIPGTLTFLPFLKRVQKLLPSPYITKCFNYNSKLLPFKTIKIMNNWKSSRTRGECILHCMWDSLNKNHCIHFYSIFDKEMIFNEEANKSNKELLKMLLQNKSMINATVDGKIERFLKMCQQGQVHYRHYVKTKEMCFNHCPVECTETTFFDMNINEYTHSDNTSSRVIIEWAAQPVTNIIHQPKWDLWDLLGTLDLPNDESTEERHIKTVEIITLSPANLNKKAKYFSIKQTRPPAISICTQCILCSYFTNESKKEIYDKDILDNDLVLSLINEDGQENVTDNPYVPYLDIDITCVFLNDSIGTKFEVEHYKYYYECSEYGQPVVSMQEGRKCFTYFSQIYGMAPWEQKQNLYMGLEYLPAIEIKIIGQLLHGKNTSVTMALHSPDGLPSMYDIPYHHIVPNEIYFINFGKEEMNFVTQSNEIVCFNYRINDTENLIPDELDEQILNTNDNLKTSSGISIYRSQAECYIYCMWRHLCFNNTINFYADFTLDLINRVHFRHEMDLLNKRITKNDEYTMNNDDTIFLTKFGQNNATTYNEYIEYKKACLSICPPSCFEEQFPEILVQNSRMPNMNYTLVGFQWMSGNQVRVVTYKNKSRLEELMGMIGGHAHVWLAISAIHIIILAINLINRHCSIFTLILLKFPWKKEEKEEGENGEVVNESTYF